MKQKKELLNIISQIIVDVSSQQKSPFTSENQLLLLCCDDIELHPRKIAIKYLDKYGKYAHFDNFTGNSAITILKKCSLGYVAERKDLLQKANAYAELLIKAIEGSVDVESLNLYPQHKQFKRLVILRFINLSLSDITTLVFEKGMRLNKDFAGDAFDNIIEIIINNTAIKSTKAVSVEDELRAEIARLSNSLNRTKVLLKNLQESFDVQLENSVEEEQERLVSMLNSEKYGYILDLLMTSKKGFSQMRRKKTPIPMEIKSIQTLVRRLLEFVEDYGVTPITEVGEILEVTANIIDEYYFEGTAFANDNEVKKVQVVSPGWEIAEREIIISMPRIREIEGE